MPFKAGFVNIIGNPNVGKSTLMNALLGEKLSIITSKAQTTRHRILGILNDENYQVVFSDTPGILKPHYKLQETMLKFVNSAFADADIMLYITDVNESWDKNADYLEKLKELKIPILLLINKIDLVRKEQIVLLLNEWHQRIPFAEIFPISALKTINLNEVSKKIIELLPEHPPYFDQDILTDKSLRFFTAEIIREKIFKQFQQEIPYSVEVEITEFNENENLNRIKAIIHVSRESQKAILLGEKGQAIKQLGISARRDIEKFTGKRLYLELFVKVTKDWRDSDRQLKKFGYV